MNTDLDEFIYLVYAAPVLIAAAAAFAFYVFIHVLRLLAIIFRG